MAVTKKSTPKTAAKSGAKSRTNTKKNAPAKSVAAPKKTAAQKRAEAATQQRQKTIGISIALFAVGLLCVVMLFVPGAAAWAAVRNFFFGVFGASFYLLGVALVYLAVLVAQEERCLLPSLKILLGMFTLSGTLVLFSKFELEGLAAGQVLNGFYQNGAEHLLGGGVIGAVFAAPLLALCGRPAANILVVILLLCVVMLVSGITPAEIAEFIAERCGSAKEHGNAAREAFLAEQEQRNVARKVRAEEHAQEKARLAAQKAAEQEEDTKARVAATVEEIMPTDPSFAEGSLDALEEDDEEPTLKPWYKLFARGEQAQPENTASEVSTEQRAAFDIDLGPSAAQVKTGVSEPIEPIAIGPGGTFGLEAVRGVASVPVPETTPVVATAPTVPSQTVVQEQSSSVSTQVTAQAAEEVSAEAFWQVPSTDTSAAPVAGQSVSAQEGWISMGDADVPATPTGAAELENLVAAAMDKPKVADAALASTPVAEIHAPRAYQYPPIDLFEFTQEGTDRSAEAELKANAQKLVETLESFGVKTRVLDISRGPSVTRYELQPLAGVKISRITNLADDIALNLSVAGVRMEAPIPGKPAVGIEVPNRKSTSVGMRGLLESKNYTHMESPLTFALGKDIAGVAQVADLCKMPHLLVAGSTGSGKSVCVNSIIISFLFRASPEDMKLILIDPKVVELAEYNGIPHLLMPVVTEPRKAAGALGSAVGEMEKRYRLFADNNVRDIKTYNNLAKNTPGMDKLPYIAIVIDELADLMMVSGKEVEDYICRIAQKARAAGMHLIVATQRPSVDVITGLIKANIPSRISFAVSSQIDSRTILDSAGAEKLLGMGDMLFMPVGAQKPTRIQGTYVKDEEISRVLAFLKAGSDAQYDEAMIAEMEKVAANQKGAAGSGGGSGKGEESSGDPMLKQCAEVVIDAGQASTSLLQRRCKLGYARAARIMDEMEQLHIIGPYEGAKPRAVLVSRQQWLEMCMNEQDAANAESAT